MVEQNRDGQMFSLLRMELDPALTAKLRSVRHFNGLPIDARSVTDDILAQEQVAHRAAGRAGNVSCPPRLRTPEPEEGQPHRPRGAAVSRRQDDAVRRLRPQRHLRAHHRRVLRDGVDPKQVIKLSGIGCSSKSPAYFLGGAHGFNSVHGRMPSVATGALLANKQLIAIGVSGDGDTGAIGIGQFVHLMRRNVPLIYIIEDNGCYGLTKGQFSPTADLGSVLKNGVVNDLPPIDTCSLAIELGASFVARSFSGDKKQLLSILKAALSHHGTCMIDVISPCVTFNDHEGSTKSYAYAKDHDETGGRDQLRPVLRGHLDRVRGGDDDRSARCTTDRGCS